jgi:hypothetical protein
MTMFWVGIVVLVLVVVGASVLVGLNLKSSRRHRASRDEMLALKSSGAFDHRKSNQP